MNTASDSRFRFGSALMLAATFSLIGCTAVLMWLGHNSSSPEDPTFAGALVLSFPLILGAAMILVMGAVAASVSKKLPWPVRKKRYLVAAIGLGTLVVAFVFR